MALPVDTSAITHGIQLAVAPVFLLTAVSSLIGAVAGRLARIIDRARVVEAQALASTDPAFRARALSEIGLLRWRGRLANGAVALLTLCAFFIGLTIIVLFVAETTDFQASRLAVAGFLGGIGCFLAALLCFFIETVLATRMLNFRLPESPT
ncbi:uncharacterized protein DUF2721 [Tibeticola sediminis]|uniref:Uncharacterized protein DUF2721 n=1 Tax=Tibeticola sediminis TaxID=1917811 RepID=A0A3N4UJK3_9BURK|nr:DUF2721 domain-containing protein [Tibeticola sediminis]RPE70633.1 uncharacterized protein DUF2721 [Tibeticola sediminis]